MAGFRSRSESFRANDNKKQPTLDSGHVRTGTGRSSGKKHSPQNGQAAGAKKSTRPSTGASQSTSPQKNEVVSSGDKPRDIALKVIHSVATQDAYANLLLPHELNKSGLDQRDSAFTTELTYGTLRSSGQLDTIIEQAAKRPVEKIDSIVLDILRLGAYQILKTRVDNYAAVNTAVEQVKANNALQAAGFTNGVLRTIARKDYEDWISELAPADPVGALAFEYAHPVWIAQQFEKSLQASNEDSTLQELETALQADDTRPLVHLAARPGVITQDELALITGGEAGKYSPYSVILSGGNPSDLEIIQQNMAHVQDEGSQLVALSLLEAPVEGHDNGRWLDLCAGPGGKAAFMGAYADTQNATVDAIEISEHRSELIRKAVKDLPVTVYTGDGRALDTIQGLVIPDAGYDRILVDAPCSGLGSLRRRPEARWRKSNSDIPGLTHLQYELAHSAAEHLRSGGVMVYSTCSPHLAETRAVVDKLLAEHDLEIIEIGDALPQLKGIDSSPFAQLWPHEYGTDAMFFAVLRKPLHM